MKVVHWLPGRMRVEVSAVYQHAHKAQHLESSLALKKGIASAKADASTGRMLVCYAPDQTDAPAILREIRGILSLPPEVASQLQSPPKSPDADEAYELERLPLGEQLGFTLATGVLMALSHFRKKNPQSAPADGSFIENTDTLLTVLSGVPIFRTALDHFFRRKLSTELLASAATLASLFQDDDQFSLSILSLVYLNTLIRSAALESVRDRIRTMLAGKKPIARLITEKGRVIVPGSQLAKGSRFEVRPGERLPADGIVEKGEGAVKEFPTEARHCTSAVASGSTVYAGSLVTDGILKVRATKVGENTKVGQLIRHLKTRKEAPDEKAVKKLNQLSAAAMAIAGGYYAITRNFRGALNMLVIGMPGAAGLAKAIPAEIAAVRAASFGSLVKSGDSLSNLGDAELMLVEDGSFLANGDPLVQDTRNYLERLNYQFPPVAVPGQGECGQEEIDRLTGIIQGWQQNNKVVGMVGADGGRAPLLSAVDIGITRATGDDLQLKSASIIITGNDPRSMAVVAELSRNARAVAKQNSKMSTWSSVLGYVLGMFGRLTPFWTGIIQNVSNIAILANSGRLLQPVSSQTQLEELMRETAVSIESGSAVGGSAVKSPATGVYAGSTRGGRPALLPAPVKSKKKLQVKAPQMKFR